MGIGLLICLGTNAQSQLDFRHYGTQDGLSNQIVNCLLQDSKGFIWIGTDDGLNRFDGVSFEQYRANGKAGDPTGNIIVSLYEDDGGRLWVCTGEGGLCYRDPVSLQFVPFRFSDAPTQPTAMAIAQDSSGRYWVGFEKFPVHHFNWGEPPREYLPANKAFNHLRVYHWLCDASGRLHAAPLGRGVMTHDGAAFKHTYSDTAQWGYVPTIEGWLAHGDTLYAGGWSNGLFKISPNDSVPEPLAWLGADAFSDAAEEVRSLTKTGNRLWVGSRYSGLYCFDLKRETLEHILPGNNGSSGLSSVEVRALLLDDSGRLWAGGSGGLDVCRPYPNPIQIIPVDPIKPQDVMEPVHCMYPDGNAVWIGTQRGLYRLEGGHMEKAVDGGDSLSFHTVLRDHYDRLWVGTNRTLYRLEDEKLRPFEVYNQYWNAHRSSFSGLDIYSSRINALAAWRVHQRDVLVVSIYGHGPMLMALDSLSAGSFVPFFLDADSTMQLENFIHDLHTDETGELWFMGKGHGVLRGLNIDQKTLSEMVGHGGTTGNSRSLDSTHVRWIPVRESHLPGLPRNAQALDLYSSSSGNRLLATYSHGLFALSDSEGQWEAQPIGGPYQAFRGVTQDQNGNIWSVSAGGLNCYLPVESRWIRLDERNGLPVSGLTGSILCMPEGDLLAAGAGFVLRFHPDSLPIRLAPPEMVVSGLNVNATRKDGLLGSQRMVLAHDQNNLEFSFSATNLSRSEVRNLSYRLVGAGEAWRELTDYRVQFADLRPGQYRLEVKASNLAGLWSTAPAVQGFTIRPPWFETWWFRGVLGALILAVALWFGRWQVTRRMKEARSRLRIEVASREAERLSIARDLHDDLGTRMSTLKLYLNTQEQLIEGSQQAHAVNLKAQSLLDDSVSSIRRMLQNLNPQSLEQFGLSRAMEELVQAIQETGQLQVELAVSDALPPLRQEVELAVFRVTQELLNNTMRHSGATLVNIVLEHQSGVLELRYSDNGKGLDLSSESKGYGLQNIRHRVEVEGGTVSFHAAPGHGMKAHVAVPLLS